ncbi:MAG: divalent-cation tolerance protein CutA [Anaerolineales bacterium]|nr:MAG: divalent-cation tolerance protein CutA [Anaerolineales bacterium]
MTEYVQVLTTVGSEEEARTIARTVVEARLAACAQVAGPIASTFWWQGSIESAQEWLCICKSSRTLYERLEAAIKALHPYEVPEILAVPVIAGSADYLAWLASELDRGSADDL